MQLRESVCIRNDNEPSISRVFRDVGRHSCTYVHTNEPTEAGAAIIRPRVGHDEALYSTCGLYNRVGAFKFASRCNGETRFSYCLTSPAADTIMETRVIALFSHRTCNSIPRFVRSRGRLISSDFIFHVRCRPERWMW